MDAERYSLLADILLDLEMALRGCDLWESEAPSSEALRSHQPFCIDTLRFSQWLQFVFLVRLRDIVACQAPLPNQSAIVVIAEENFRGASYDFTAIIDCLARFDALIQEH